MFIRYFKSNQPATVFLVPFIVGILWTGAILQPKILAPPDATPLYSYIASILLRISPYWSALLAVALVSVQAIYFNSLVSKHEILNKPSQLPTLMYVILMSLFPGELLFHPMLLVNILFLMVIDKIFKLYKNTHPLPLIFDIGFLISIASLLYFPAICILLLLWVGLFILRPIIWREWIVGLIGFALPYFFAGLYYFWYDKLGGFINQQILLNLNAGYRFDFVFTDGNIFTLSVLGFIFLLCFIKLRAGFYKNVIRTRNYQQVGLAFLIITAFSFLLGDVISFSHFTMMAIPLSVFIAYYFLVAQRIFWAEALFLLLSIALLYNHLVFYL